MKKERLRIENGQKGHFLKWIQLQIFEQEVVHCVFDNVQEKDMLLDILVGKESVDFGKLYYAESIILKQDVKKTMKESVALICKDSTLIDSISIVENIFLMRPYVSGYRVQTRYYKKKAKALFAKFNIGINIDTPTHQLTTFEKVQIEMLKAYLLNKKVLVFTTLTNILSDRERMQLWELIEQFKQKRLSCIIAEPLEDISFQHTDRVIIFKHGKTSIVKDIDDCDYMMLHTILYQNSISASDEREFLLQDKEGSLEITKLSTAYLKDISLSIMRGEILKVFCMDEHSYEELVGVFKGKVPIISGYIQTAKQKRAFGKTIKGIRDGIGVLDGNPVINTLFKELTAMDNLCMLLSQKVLGVFAKSRYRRSVKLMLKDILPEEIYAKQVGELTASQVQKVAYARWFVFSPDVLVCIQPFADGDIHGREAAREMLYMLESRKIPILIVTSNTLEFNYCSGTEVYIKRGKLIQKEEAYQSLNLRDVKS